MTNVRTVPEVIGSGRLQYPLTWYSPVPEGMRTVPHHWIFPAGGVQLTEVLVEEKSAGGEGGLREKLKETASIVKQAAP